MLSTLIQTYFIDHIEATHGKPPKDTFADELAARLTGSEFTAEELTAAGEHIVQNKKSKTFPDFSTCLTAIRKFHGTKQVFTSGTAANITAENYAQKASEHGKARGFKILSAAHMDAVDAWVGYRRWKGLPTWLLESQIASGREFTVPSLYPWEFDRECSSSIGVRVAEEREKAAAQKMDKGKVGDALQRMGFAQDRRQAAE